MTDTTDGAGTATLPGHLATPQELLFNPFNPFHLEILLSVLLRLTSYDYVFNIFKLFIINNLPSFLLYESDAPFCGVSAV